MRFLLLGPFAIMDGERPAAVGKGNERALIALLALHANTVVSTDRIVDGMWGDRPPATARDMVRLYVGRARGRVGDRLVTEATGYRLRTERDEVDVEELERLRRAGTDAIAAGDPAAAAAHLSEAVGLVRGEPLAEFAEFPFAREEIPRLDELRLGTTEEYYDALLTGGDGAELVPALEQLVEENPYRERLRGQLMLALYRAGRQTDALTRYREGRRLLADEVGIEPSPRLRELERAILQHDPELLPPGPADGRDAPAEESARSVGQRPWLILAGLLGLVAIGLGATVLGLTRTGQPAGLRSLPANSVGIVDPTNDRLESPIRLSTVPVDLTGGAGRLWVAMGVPSRIGEIDPNRATLTGMIHLPSDPRRIGAAAGNLWIDDSYSGRITRLDATNGQLGKPVKVFGPARISFARSADALWVAGDLDREVARVDPRSGRAISRIRKLASPIAIATGSGALWLASADRDELQMVKGNKVSSVQLGALPVAVATGGKAVWAVSPSDGRLWRVDPRRRDVAAWIRIPGDPRSVAFGHGSVWVGSEQAGTVVRVSPRTNTVIDTIRIGRPVKALSYYDGRLWVAAAHS